MPAGITLVPDSGVTLDGNGKVAWVVVIGGGTLLMKAGAALHGSTGGGVYVDGNPSKVRNSAAGPGVDLDSRVSGRAGGW